MREHRGRSYWSAVMANRSCEPGSQLLDGAICPKGDGRKEASAVSLNIVVPAPLPELLPGVYCAQTIICTRRSLVESLGPWYVTDELGLSSRFSRWYSSFWFLLGSWQQRKPSFPVPGKSTQDDVANGHVHRVLWEATIQTHWPNNVLCPVVGNLPFVLCRTWFSRVKWGFKFPLLLPFACTPCSLFFMNTISSCSCAFA